MSENQGEQSGKDSFIAEGEKNSDGSTQMGIS